MKEGLVSFPNTADPCCRVRAMGGARRASPALQTLIDLSNMASAQAQEQDPTLKMVMDMLQASTERPA